MGGSGGAGGGQPAIAFYKGHPPVIPHGKYGCGPICMTCHETGAANSPKVLHPEWQVCTACHLYQEAVPDFVANTFKPD